MTALKLRTCHEFGFVGLVLLLLAALVYGPHAVQGGFVGDAWRTLALYEFSGTGAQTTLSRFLEQPYLAVRPLQAVNLTVLYELFGSRTGIWLTWQLTTNAVMALALYVLLRRLTFRTLDALAIAALVLLFPGATALRFWTPVVGVPLSITFVLFGFVLALSAFKSTGRRATALHATSLLLFVTSLLLYEATVLIMLASVLLYRLQVPWRAATRRWATDCAALIPLVLLVTLSPSGHEETAAGVWSHATTMLSQSPLVLATVVLPLGSASWYLLSLLALVPAVAVLVHRRLPAGDPTKRELGRWLVAMVAGAIVIALGYAVYVPGTDYYIPMGSGIANRVNAVPSIGWALILYAGVATVATVALRDLPHARPTSSALASIACALIAIGWIVTLAEDSDRYAYAYAEDRRVLATIRAALPHPPPASTIWTFGQPVEVAPGVPVFGNTWDMTGAVQVTLGDATLSSYVAIPKTTFVCQRNRVLPAGAYAVDGAPDAERSARYGRTYFIDTLSGRLEAIRSRRLCRRAARSFSRSPALAG